MLAATANPEDPDEVDVTQPSAALVARADAQSAFNGLFLGLGAVALLVGAVGVANIMVISVLERRSEIGLRRALGATKGHIRTQFLSEAILLALLGGARRRLARGHRHLRRRKGWAIIIPPWPGRAGSARRCSSARSPACCRRCAPLDCHRPRRCGRCDGRPQASGPRRSPAA